MSNPEHGGPFDPTHAEPDRHPDLAPGQLPEDLAAYLATQEVACLFHETTRGTALVVKLPADEIERLRGTIPVRLRHELYAHPAAPVIRTVLTLYDQPEAPMVLETVTNVASDDRRAD